MQEEWYHFDTICLVRLMEDPQGNKEAQHDFHCLIETGIPMFTIYSYPHIVSWGFPWKKSHLEAWNEDISRRGRCLLFHHKGDMDVIRLVAGISNSSFKDQWCSALTLLELEWGCSDCMCMCRCVHTCVPEAQITVVTLVAQATVA